MTEVLAIATDTVEPATASRAERCEDYRLRAQFYRLLSGAFIEEPAAAYLSALRSPETLAALAELGVRFDADFLEPPITALEQALAHEYTMLFAASGGFPPVESVRRQGGYQQAACFEVREVYRRAGFQVVPGRFQVFEDQLGIELQFVAELLERCAAALDRGEHLEARRLEKEIKRFWALHLGRWIRGYGVLLEKVTEHSFYREMARLLRGFAEAELELLGVHVEDEDHGKLKVQRSELAGLVEQGASACGACRGTD
ncbi:MAG: molecular chaperone TorD family protein [Gammaproteobacteria bacterium]